MCDTKQRVLELQNTIIENQQYIIGELMKLYCREKEFCIDDELQSVIRENNRLLSILNTPSGRR